MSKLHGKEGLIGLCTVLAASSCSCSRSWSCCSVWVARFNVVTMLLATVIMLGVIWTDFFAAL